MSVISLTSNQIADGLVFGGVPSSLHSFANGSDNINGSGDVSGIKSFFADSEGIEEGRYFDEVGVYYVVRFWSKTLEELDGFFEKLVQRQLCLKSQNACVRGLGYIFVIDAQKDVTSEGYIRDLLHGKFAKWASSNQYFIVNHSSYTWSNANNTAIELIAALTKEMVYVTSKVGVFFQSFDVELDKDEYLRVYSAFVKGYIVPSARIDADSVSSRIDMVKDIGVYLQYIGGVAQGIQVLPRFLGYMRNTCILYPLDILLELHGFNTLCDTGNTHIGALYGMEDIEFFRRLILSGNIHRLLLDDCVIYRDIRWNSLQPELMGKKKTRELITVCKILQGLVG